MDSSQVLGFIDIGTNSVRLLVIRVFPDQNWEILIRHKNSVRLGEGEFETNCLTREAIERTSAIITRYVEIAREFGASEIVAVATSATRDAENRLEFTNNVLKRTGIRISVLSGEEEARLIWLGVSQGFRLGLEKALCIDIGGGSTEIIIGDQVSYDLLCSLPLGAIRLTTQFFNKVETNISPLQISILSDHIDLFISKISHELQVIPYTQVFGSSGTILALESVASEHPELSQMHKSGILTIPELNSIIKYLMSLTLQKRRRVPGLNPNRADIIIAGAVLLQRLLVTSGHSEIRVSNMGLIFGLVKDTLSRVKMKTDLDLSQKRHAAVTELGKKFHLNDTHSCHVMNLAIMLFDSSREIGLHTLSESVREILIHAAYLHDIGSVISFSRHHHHSYYIITSSSLSGFSQDELRMIGLITRYHRKKPPKNKDEVLVHLHRGERRTIQILSQILRLAENLDRTHDMRVESARFVRMPGKPSTIEIYSSRDCTAEWIACQESAESYEKVFNIPLIITMVRNQQISLATQSDPVTEMR